MMRGSQRRAPQYLQIIAHPATAPMARVTTSSVRRGSASRSGSMGRTSRRSLPRSPSRATPWLRWERGAYAPDQAVLIDLAHRRFYFFFVEIWPQEFYYIAGLLIMAGVGLFLVTSVVGRAWCGYACPQTVWTDLFLVVERW